MREKAGDDEVEAQFDVMVVGGMGVGAEDGRVAKSNGRLDERDVAQKSRRRFVGSECFRRGWAE